MNFELFEVDAIADNVILEKSDKFALDIIRLYQQLQEQREYVLSKLRSGTSIGANVEEAIAAQSRNHLLSKMSIASKEARETRYWLRLLRESKLVISRRQCHERTELG